jgi:DDE family transposase
VPRRRGHPSEPRKKKSPVGVTRAGVVYELFFTNLPPQGFTACDVVEVYLHRGAFEPTLADEDQEIDPDRWCSHTAWGQEAWCLVSQWVWNLRLEVGHEIEPAPVRTTAFAAAIPSQHEQAAARPPSSPRAAGYGPPTAATSWKTGRFTGAAFPLQPDGTLQCPAGQSLRVQQRRRERDGSLRVVYAASIRHCRACPLRQQCQWNGSATAKPRQVSVLLHPLQVGSAPLRLRTTGAAESTGAPACNSCATSAWR